MRAVQADPEEAAEALLALFGKSGDEDALMGALLVAEGLHALNLVRQFLVKK